MHPRPFLAEILQGNNFCFFLFENSMYCISKWKFWVIFDKPTSLGRCDGLAVRIFKNMQIRSKRTMYSLVWCLLGFFGFSIRIRSQLASHCVQSPKYQMTMHKRLQEKKKLTNDISEGITKINLFTLRSKNLDFVSGQPLLAFGRQGLEWLTGINRIPWSSKNKSKD